MNRNNSWFPAARYGFFMHFLAGNPGADKTTSIAAWNRKVEAFDTDALAEQLHRLNAGYFFLTPGQNSGMYCAPNATYDRLLGRTAENSMCAKRDLIMDMAKSLAKYHIPLMLYTTNMAPGFDLEAQEKLESVPPWNSNLNCGNYATLKHLAVQDRRLKNFLRRWEAIHEEWALRYGKLVRGWWIDGCYFQKELLDFPDAPNFSSFAAALRAGNPDALVTFSPSVVYPPVSISAEDDYTAGETNDPWRALVSSNKQPARSPYYHILTFAGKSWGSADLRFSSGELAAITRAANQRNGVISWDIPYERSAEKYGTIPDAFFHAFAEAQEILQSDATAPFELNIHTQDAWYGKTDGKVVVETNSELPFEVTNGSDVCRYEGRRHYEIPVPAASIGRHRLVFRWGRGYCRPVETICREECFQLNRILTGPAGAVGSLQIIPHDRTLAIDVELFEKTPIVNHQTPWSASCLELFFCGTAAIKPLNCLTAVDICQLFVCPDGTILSLAHETGTPVPEHLTATRTQTDKGWRCQFEIPCSFIPGFNGTEVFLEAIAHRNNAAHWEEASLYGSANAAAIPESYGRLLFTTINHDK